jgi:hypothetical protein
VFITTFFCKQWPLTFLQCWGRNGRASFFIANFILIFISLNFKCKKCILVTLIFIAEIYNQRYIFLSLHCMDDILFSLPFIWTTYLSVLFFWCMNILIYYYETEVVHFNVPTFSLVCVFLQINIKEWLDWQKFN